MYVIESSSNSEVFVDFIKGFISVGNFFRLCVEVGVVDICVVYIVFFFIGYVKFNFECYVDFVYMFVVFGVDFYVFFQVFFGKVEYVRIVEWIVVIFIEFFFGFYQFVNLGQEFFCVVVGVQNDGYIISLCYCMYMYCFGDFFQDGSVFFFIGEAFVGYKVGIIIRELDDNGGIDFLGSFEYCINGVGVYYVDGRQCEIVFVCIVQ